MGGFRRATQPQAGGDREGVSKDYMMGVAEGEQGGVRDR